MDNQAYFADALAKHHDERRYRVFADIERHAGRFRTPDGIRPAIRAMS